MIDKHHMVSFPSPHFLALLRDEQLVKGLTNDAVDDCRLFMNLSGCRSKDASRLTTPMSTFVLVTLQAHEQALKTTAELLLQ